MLAGRSNGGALPHPLLDPVFSANGDGFVRDSLVACTTLLFSGRFGLGARHRDEAFPPGQIRWRCGVGMPDPYEDAVAVVGTSGAGELADWL